MPWRRASTSSSPTRLAGQPDVAGSRTLTITQTMMRENGRQYNKVTLASKLGVHEATAQRSLNQLHSLGIISIVKWTKHARYARKWMPTYKFGQHSEPDRPKDVSTRRPPSIRSTKPPVVTSSDQPWWKTYAKEPR